MESQPQNPEFRNNPESFHPCSLRNKQSSFMAKFIIMNILYGKQC